MEKVLVVIDMQNDFIDGSLGNDFCHSIVSNVANCIKEFEGKIFLTRDCHNEKYNDTIEGKKLPVLHCQKGTKGFELHDEVKKAIQNKKYKIFDKLTFGSVKLAKFLLSKKYKDITLIGVCTDICVISNALLIKSFLPNSSIKVISSCCAGTSKESHERALEAMKMCHIYVE